MTFGIGIGTCQAGIAQIYVDAQVPENFLLKWIPKFQNSQSCRSDGRDILGRRVFKAAVGGVRKMKCWKLFSP